MDGAETHTVFHLPTFIFFNFFFLHTCHVAPMDILRPSPASLQPSYSGPRPSSTVSGQQGHQQLPLLHHRRQALGACREANVWRGILASKSHRKNRPKISHDDKHVSMGIETNKNMDTLQTSKISKKKILPYARLRTAHNLPTA